MLRLFLAGGNWIGTKIMQKEWGMEIRVVNNKLYAGRILRMKSGRRTSLHMHRKKDETIYVIGGKIMVDVNGRRLFLGDGDSIRIKPKTWHRIYAITDALLAEFSNGYKQNDIIRVVDRE